MWSSGILEFVVLLIPLIDAAFHEIDITNFTRDAQPDPKKLSDPRYFRRWLTNQYNSIATDFARAGALTEWEHETDLNNETEADTVKSAQQSAKFAKMVSRMVQNFNISSKDPQLIEVRKKLIELGDAALSPDDLSELTSIVNLMNSVYATATICFDGSASVKTLVNLTASGCPKDKQVALDPTLTTYMREVWNNTEKRKYVWKSWRDASGKTIRANYTRYIDLKNKAARLTGYADAGQLWRANYVVDALNYTDADFLTDLEGLWQTIRPMYLQLHTYVRRQIIKKFPHENVSATGPVPAHLLGDIFSQEWVGMLNFTQLFPSKPLLDVTEEMKTQNYTVKKMFHLSEQFQKDLGLIAMPQTFWNSTMFEKPKDKDVVCHASAWDFYRKNDVRVKMCTIITMEDLITIHHEMGHIQYFLQYANQSLAVFRDGANMGFHEAVGDTLALSVKTPKHLTWLGLLKNNVDDSESDLNYMFATALEKLAFLPYAYILDRYRYDVFSGNISKKELNAGWWKYRTKYQGVIPPVPRSESDFDPGAKFHVDADVEYMRYFLSYVLQFQFHKALCNASGHKGPLYQCDINQSKAAGKLFSDMLSLGASQPWPVALEKLTGSRKMDAGPLVEFFEPVIKHLRDINVKNKEKIGWD